MRPDTWFDALYRCQQLGESYVLITVMTIAGSTPREAGCKMVITADSQYDTIGGGHLEYQAVAKARELLANGQQVQHIESYPLSSKLGQCCGGAMKVFFEVQATHTQHVAVFGGGHVAHALVPILAQLPLQIHWIDNREDCFDNTHAPSNVKCIVDDDPVAEMASLPDSCWTIILTHNHQLDYELVEQGLKHGRLGFLGMIGSTTKAKRFKTRLASRGFTEQQIESVTSPIGNTAIPGKRPIEVAVSISAQLMTKLNTEKADEHQAVAGKKIPSEFV